MQKNDKVNVLSKVWQVRILSQDNGRGIKMSKLDAP